MSTRCDPSPRTLAGAKTPALIGPHALQSTDTRRNESAHEKLWETAERPALPPTEHQSNSTLNNLSPLQGLGIEASPSLSLSRDTAPACQLKARRKETVDKADSKLTGTLQFRRQHYRTNGHKTQSYAGLEPLGPEAALFLIHLQAFCSPPASFAPSLPGVYSWKITSSLLLCRPRHRHTRVPRTAYQRLLFPGEQASLAPYISTLVSTRQPFLPTLSTFIRAPPPYPICGVVLAKRQPRQKATISSIPLSASFPLDSRPLHLCNTRAFSLFASQHTSLL